MAQVIAAMSVSVPEPRFTEDRIPVLFSILMDGARQLSLRMGCPPERLPDIPLTKANEVPSGVR